MTAHARDRRGPDLAATSSPLVHLTQWTAWRLSGPNPRRVYSLRRPS